MYSKDEAMRRQEELARGKTRREMGNKPPHLADYLYYETTQESYKQADVADGAIRSDCAMRSRG